MNDESTNVRAITTFQMDKMTPNDEYREANAQQQPKKETRKINKM